MSDKSTHPIRLASGIAALLASGAAAGQAPPATETLQEIIVTATKREESLQQVPIAISVISEQALRQSGATDFASIVQESPGIELRTEQKGAGAASIRGIAELNTGNIFGTTGTAVGLYIDESPFSVGGFFPQSALYDVQRVEILRGPQGTIFGEGSLAGTIRIITNRPDPTAFHGSIDAGYGSIKDGGSNKNVSAMLNVPVVKDRLALRVVGFYYDDGGWIDRIDPVVNATFAPPPNLILGPGLPAVAVTYAAGPTTRNVNTSETRGGRAQVEWRSGPFAATLSVLSQSTDNAFRNRAAKDRIGSFSTDDEELDDRLDMYGLVLDWDLGHGSLLSSTNYFDRDLVSVNDQIGLLWLTNQIVYPLSVFIAQSPLVEQGSRARYDLNVQEFNQELRYVSDFQGPFEITAGVFYRDRDYSNRFRAPQEPLVPAYVWDILCGGSCGLPNVPGSGDFDILSDSNTRQKAVFAEATYKVTDSIKLLAGGRYFKDTRDSDSTVFGVFSGFARPTPFTSTFKDKIFNPRASITWNVSERTTTYFSYSRGFRSGGSNDLFGVVPGATAADETYGPERLTAYELGIKGTALDGAFAYGASLFLNRWTDLQVVTKEGPGGAGEIISNVGDADSKGLDVEASIRAGDHLTIAVNGTVLETNIDDILASGINLQDVDIPFVAKKRLNGTITWRQPFGDRLTGFVRANVSCTSSAKNNLTAYGTPNEKIPSYTTLGLRIGVEAENWNVTLYGNNLTDEFIPFSQFLGSNPSAPLGGDVVTGKPVYYQGSPRVLGVSIGLKF